MGAACGSGGWRDLEELRISGKGVERRGGALVPAPASWAWAEAMDEIEDAPGSCGQMEDGWSV